MRRLELLLENQHICSLWVPCPRVNVVVSTAAKQVSATHGYKHLMMVVVNLSENLRAKMELLCAAILFSGLKVAMSQIFVPNRTAQSVCGGGERRWTLMTPSMPANRRPPPTAMEVTSCP